MRRPRTSLPSKRRKASSKAAENGGKSTEELSKGSTRGKRVKAPASSKPMKEPEYLSDKRNLEDLWQSAFPVGMEWDEMDKLMEINWNFSNLESAFEDGGELYGKKIYMFGSAEPQLLVLKDKQKIFPVPSVVVVVSPIPPSDKIVVTSILRATEDIVPMKAMKMAWIPYIPLEDRQSQLDRLKPQIFTMGCTQRRSALKHLKIECVKQYNYCQPYLQPLEADEIEETSVVDIMYPLEPPLVCDFDWELDDLEEFTERLIKEEQLPKDQKDAFKEYVTEQIREMKKAQRQAKEARKKAKEDMDQETIAAFQNMRIYKFYPIQTPHTPNIIRGSYINRYYGKAHVVI